MIVFYIMYGILTLVTLTGWGFMLYGVVKERKALGKLKGTAVCVAVTLAAVIGCFSLFNSYPF